MALKASVPVNKEILADHLPGLVRRSAGVRGLARVRPLKPAFVGYNEFNTILQTELDENVFNAANKTAADAIGSVNEELNGILAAGHSRPASRQRSSRTPCDERSSGSSLVRAGPDRHAVHADRGGAPASRGPRGHDERWAYLFIAPMVLGLAFLSAGPILATFGISLTSWDLLRPRTRRAGQLRAPGRRQRFFSALRNTTFYTVVSVPLGLVLSLGLALALNQAIRGISWIRTMYFLPLVTSAIAVGLVWAWIYSPTSGLLNQLLGVLASRPRSGSPIPSGRCPRSSRCRSGRACPRTRSSSWPASRRSRGLLRRRQRRRRGPQRRFRHVTLPLLTPSLFFTGILSLIGAFQVFDQVFVLSRPGKPTDATITMVYFIYENGFRNFKMGYASAASWVLFLIVAALMFVYFRSQRRWVHYQ